MLILEIIFIMENISAIVLCSQDQQKLNTIYKIFDIRKRIENLFTKQNRDKTLFQNQISQK